MFVLIWATLLFSVGGISTDTGASVGIKGECQAGFCITLREGEITAEAGLCVVIPCSFNTTSSFTPQHIVWFKCEPSRQKCGDSDIVLHTNKNNKVQRGFTGRVSLLEPDVSRRNCSIIINDLTESDSGSYQLRVNGKPDGFSFATRAAVSVKALIQKPTVMIPPLTEGRQSTLTCTAPGLCSGSDPEITWTWRAAGEKDSHITGNITDFNTEHLTAVTRRRSSTLTFNSSAEHHGTEVTCKVSFTGNTTTEETKTLTVTYVKELEISGITTVKKNDALNLTCSVDSFPASLIMWTKFGSNESLHEENENKPQKHNGSASLIIHNMTAEHSGQYICTAKHLNNTLVKKVDVTSYLKKPVITGNTTVAQGDALNLTCSVESFRPSVITWTKLNKILQKETRIALQNDTGTATLVMLNVTAEYSGQYICTAQHQITNQTTRAEVNVTFFPRILSSSACAVQSEVLTCVCISEGFPLPTIKWPLLDNYTEYSVTSNVANHTVNNSITVSVKDRNYTTVECVSSSDVGDAKEKLKIITNELKQEDVLKRFLLTFEHLKVIIAFLIGILLSATICCLARKCCRNKQKRIYNMAETVEMVTAEEAPMIDAGQAMKNYATHDQEAAAGGAEAAGQSAPDSDMEPKEVEYSHIDFSLLKSSTGAEDTRETTETEYAEIKNKETEERQEDGVEGGGEEEEEVIIGEDEETKQCMSTEEEGGDDVPVYSNVNEIMGDM